MKFLRITPALGLLFLMLAGCAGIGKQLEPPRISLANIQVQELKGFETVFEIQIRVFNTNDVDLNVKGIEAELEINGRPFATGVSNSPVDIPAFGTELVTVTVYSSVIDIVKSIHSLHRSEQLKYRLNGKLRAAGDNLLPVTLPFESDGQVTLDDFKEQEK
jgi:LEA14-like dessication related protein